MLVLENNTEYEFFINTPIAGLSTVITNLSQNASTASQATDGNEEAAQPTNTETANVNNSINNSTQNSNGQSTTNIEDLFN